MSNNLGLSQIAATQSNKHVTANDQVGQLDAALTEVLSVEIDDTNAATVLTEDFQRHAFFDVVDAVTPPNAAITLTVPVVKRGLFVVRNETAQDTTIEITGQPSTSPVVPAGVAGLLICDGVNVVLAGLSTVGADSDERLKVSANDTTAGYLLSKLAAGGGIALVETNDGSDEDVTIRASRLAAIRVYTASDTWNKPADLDFVIAHVVGGGGGSGGAAATGVGEASSSAGGGGGGFASKKIDAASLGASETVTVGTGGSGGTAGNNDGSPGGTSSFGAHVSATGGAGGAGSQASAGSIFRPGGAGGTGSGGDLNISGSYGGWGMVVSGARLFTGSGGSSRYAGQAQSGAGGVSTAGAAYGGGAAGTAQAASGGALAGAAGATGIVIVWEYLK